MGPIWRDCADWYKKHKAKRTSLCDFFSKKCDPSEMPNLDNGQCEALTCAAEAMAASFNHATDHNYARTDRHYAH
jgi:hypothetical protein